MAAVTDAYATAAEYRAAVNKDDTSEDAEILTDLTAVTRYIEKRLAGRFFNKDAAAVVRVYEPQTANFLDVDDLVSVTSIKVDDNIDGVFETTLTTSDYELLPRNAGDGPEPGPYTRVKLTPWGSFAAFTSNAQVEITGVFGWPAVPEAVKRACIHMTAILRLETPRASRNVSDAGEILGVSFSAQNMIEDLIRHYGKVTT